ncbi:PAS domain-containing protein [Halobaculum sp. WSA2]|uniref:histidine kinase n=1 Tax=Halobaculum saliterrae TaxID=2073113 RepID=A0A6B0T0B3_9EURY|nr:ATP-binding protein [Halobaculum saliterrae]MXR42273.1 PAS domain-containing protein [Halobaculum saliterrae]
MYVTPTDRALAILAVGFDDARPCSPGGLERALPESSSVTAVGSIAAALERDLDALDCVVAAFRLPDGTAADLQRRLSELEAPPPVVLVVDASGGSVPAAAVSTPFDEVVAAGCDDRDEPLPARVATAIATVVPDDEGPTVADGCPRDRRSLDAWKSTLFDRLLTDIPMHAFVKDRDARHVMVSEAAVDERIDRLGGDFLGRRDIDGLLPEAEARKSYEDDRRVIETGEAIVDKEEYYSSADRWFRTSKVPWTDGDGEVAGLIGVAQEITARKDRERQLEITHHVVRHTLRNKLNVIIGRCDRIRQGGRVAGNLERIADAARSLTDTVDNQQTILEMMLGEPEQAPTNLTDLVRHRIEAAEARRPDAAIDAVLENDVVGLATDSAGRAVDQLLRNALEHADGTPRLTVTLERADDEVRLCVRDGPPGIPPFEVEVLTGRRSIDHLNHTTGLGLWIVQWAMKHAGGEVSFDRTDDGGNAVTLRFPRPDEEVDLDQVADPAERDDVRGPADS